MYNSKAALRDEYGKKWNTDPSNQSIFDKKGKSKPNQNVTLSPLQNWNKKNE
jgi:hypothetical protein